MAERNPGRRARSRRTDMTCERVTALVRDYLAGELSPEMTATFEEHLRLCQDCVAFLKTYQKTTQAVESLRYEDIPAEMRIRVHQFLRAKLKGFPLGG
jgi:predicted anti-sigma-YlaC factor YlaD